MKGHTLISILDGTRRRLEQAHSFQPGLEPREYGHVRSIGEGFARVSGLPGVGSGELVRFADGSSGLAYNLDPGEAGIILLDSGAGIEAGGEVTRTGRVLDVPVGEMLVGRVVDALGCPLDGRGAVYSEQRLPVERPAPPIIHRAPVHRPLQTGILAVDALFPIGRGQRELILGDRQTGKTTLAVDAMLNQRGKDVICIYCAVGKRKAAVARVIADLRRFDAMEYTLVVSAGSEDSPGQQFIAPYSAASMGEYFLHQGRDVLIVYDDLTWHARAYRELALLLRRPPGREAYPGDIFYIHSRLLERAAQLKPAFGGGSVTALPIVETQAQNIAGFIPTNLISITDGQLFLSNELLRKDVMPAVDAGMSVSRVGGAAQFPVYRSVTGKLRIAYAQFEELETFSRFSSRLDERTRQQIDRGRRIREVLKQPPFEPLQVDEQLALLLAVTSGLLDEVGLDEMEPVKRRILEVLRADGADVDRLVDRQQLLDEEDRARLLDRVRKALEKQTGT